MVALPSRSMKARAAVVIGVSSLPGIGHSVAKRFVQDEGMKVGIVGRRADRLERAKADIEREAGAGAACAYRVCDAGRREELHEALSSMMKGELAGCELSCLVFNASARPFPLASVMDLDTDRLEGDHRTSAAGFVAAAQWAVPQMRSNDVGPAGDDATRGTIILTGATASLRGSAKFGSFCASKAAARSLCMSLAREVREQTRSLAR